MNAELGPGQLGLMRWCFIKLAQSSIDRSTLSQRATTGPRRPPNLKVDMRVIKEDRYQMFYRGHVQVNPNLT